MITYPSLSVFLEIVNVDVQLYTKSKVLFVFLPIPAKSWILCNILPIDNKKSRDFPLGFRDILCSVWMEVITFALQFMCYTVIMFK